MLHPNTNGTPELEYELTKENISNRIDDENLSEK